MRKAENWSEVEEPAPAEEHREAFRPSWKDGSETGLAGCFQATSRLLPGNFQATSHFESTA